MSSNSLATAAKLTPPHGLDQIIETFGDIFVHIGPDHALDAHWQTDSLAHVSLAFPMKLSWDQSRTVTHISCHKLMTGHFCRGIPEYSECWFAEPRPQLRWMLCISPPAHRHKAFNSRMGNCDRSES